MAVESESSSFERFIIANISEPAEWKRDYKSDTKDYIAWQPTDHILKMSEFKKLLKNPAVASKLKNQKNKTSVTIELPDMYIMSGDADYLVARVTIPNTKKPTIVCTWPSQPRRKEEDELESQRKRIAELEAEIQVLKNEKAAEKEKCRNLQWDLQQANLVIERLNRQLYNPHLPEQQLEDELREPKEEP